MSWPKEAAPEDWDEARSTPSTQHPGDGEARTQTSASPSDSTAQADLGGDVSAALSGLGDRPVEEHPEIYEAIHERLGKTLAGIDDI